MTLSSPLSSLCFNQLHVLVVAAGVGKRFGTTHPKQYTLIHDRTVLEHSIGIFGQLTDSHGQGIACCYVVISPEDTMARTLSYPMPITWATGGIERMHSVLNGVQAIWQQTKAADRARQWVLIHDAARPCVSADDMYKLLNVVGELQPAGGAILAVPVRDTIKQAVIAQSTFNDTPTILAKNTLDRSQLWLAQTPQVFPLVTLYHYLSQAIEQDIAFTDEASLFEHFADAKQTGDYPVLVAGSHTNIKLTFAEDMVFAKAFLTP